MKMKEDLLEQYEIIETEDGSKTYFSKNFNEACHSTSGAANETKLHYIKGCQIIERLKESKSIKILEVGFGTGLGFTETLKATKEFGKLIFFSFEIDENLVKHFFEKSKLPFKKEGSRYTSNGENFELNILVGNARDEISKLNETFHAIYQDAFSPKRNSILWTTEWFEALRQRSEETCIMSTYSSSSSIRKSMIAAGWKLTKGEKFGPKRSSTRAKLQGESDREIIEHLERSPVQTLTDINYKEYKI